MTAIKQVNIAEVAVPVPQDPHTELERLAELHAEAQETALLANLLGRAPYAMVALAVCAGLAVAVSAAAMPVDGVVTWLILMIAGLAAVARAYAHAIAAPFERAVLKSFVHDLLAITVYLGFTWGAGAFLVLSKSDGIFAALLFAGGASAIFAGLIRERNMALGFLVPAMFLSAFACVLRPMPGGALSAALVLIGCGAVASAVVAAARFTSLQPGLQAG